VLGFLGCGIVINIRNYIYHGFLLIFPTRVLKEFLAGISIYFGFFPHGFSKDSRL
jgi:hypothetical protein